MDWDANAIALAGGYACVAGASSGLRIIDASDPTGPGQVGSLDAPGIAWHVAVSGSLGYVGARDGGLRIVDVSSPEWPAELAGVPTADRAWDAAVVGDRAYVAASGSSLLHMVTADVSDPALPVESQLDVPRYPISIMVTEGYGFVGSFGNPGGVYISDVSDPSVPEQASCTSMRNVMECRGRRRLPPRRTTRGPASLRRGQCSRSRLLHGQVP